MTTWRARASQVGLGVDAWLAALVEFELVRSHMAELGLDAEEVVSAAERSLKVSRLAPTPGLRQWSAQLSDPGSQGNPPPDELPSVVLPERLLAQLAPSKVGEFLANAAGEGVESEALLLERAAAAYGVTMDTWAYQVALRRLQTAGGLS